MSAPFRCKYCCGPVNARANGRPLPCPTLTCPCDIGIDAYAHVYSVPEQDHEPLIPGFSKPYAPHPGPPRASMDEHDVLWALAEKHKMQDPPWMEDVDHDGATKVQLMTGQALGKSTRLFGMRVVTHADAPKDTITFVGGSLSDECVELPRLVVCAANRNAHGKIAVGARHFDARMREQISAFGDRAAWFRAEQGFIDQYGEFMTRAEAWKVAEAAGQIRRRCGGDGKDGGTLFSENLY